ncbi:F-box domain-containing protein [Heracleum sosnowskyi]|uniref:F-box domain-containing protein n=1 Tax=Heracleum sosnowskyi TaxID=360622 RepID=A0AAD8MN21_9APIA|nr:F-box domain-containing protein [Heracleum sosnowskyi]
MCDFTGRKIVDDPLKTYLSDSFFVGSCNGAINLMIPTNLIRSSAIRFGYDHVKNTNNIIAFDLGVHKHGKLPLPAGASKKSDCALFVFNRCLETSYFTGFQSHLICLFGRKVFSRSVIPNWMGKLSEEEERKINDSSIRTCLSGTSKYLGSCNGIDGFWTPTNLEEGEDDIFLWNPKTRELKKLPRVNNILIPIQLIGVELVGFGYDHVNDDYKVMRTSGYGPINRTVVVSVYSLKNNSWARAETISTGINLSSFSLYSKFGVFANGSLFWLGKDNICAYDLGVHRLSELPFPPGLDKKNGKALHDFNRCLCFIDTCPGSRLDMWVLNNNRVENSWSKLISVEQPGPGVLGSFEFIYPITFSKAQNEILLMVDDNRLVWYDRERNQFKNVALHGFPESFDLLDYDESLLQVSASELDSQSEEEEKKQMEDALRECLAFKSDVV